MIPGNVDPRRPDKVQRYKAPQANGNAPAEDLTPDYMNILGPESTTANAESSDGVKLEPTAQPLEEPHAAELGENVPANASATNVIPTSPQYGVAIIPTTTAIDVAGETTTPSTDTVTETTAKSTDGDNKDMHSTPSRNDRFKVVKIASLEPFRRGRWKCMDYVDETPPSTTIAQTKAPQSQGSTQVAGTIYMQTQSLPQQHIQQMLLQGGYTNAPQFYQNMPNQGMPQTQYFYAAQPTNMQPQTLPQQIINSSAVPQGAIQPQFINTSQAYFPANVVPNSAVFTLPNYPNVQYVPSTLIPNQGSAFVPTTQNVNQLPPNFQQSQTYAGPPTATQPNVPQPMVNGHAYPNQNEQQQPQVVASSLPTQTAKNVILNQTISQTQANQPQTVVQNQIPQSMTVQSAPQSQTVSVQNVVPSQQPFSQQFQQTQQTVTPQTNQVQQQTIGNQQSSVSQLTQQNVTQVQPNPPQNVGTTQQNVNPPQTNVSQVTQVHTIPQVAPTLISVPQAMNQPIQVQTFDPSLPTNVYTNPQFVASVNSVQNVEGEGAPLENHADGANEGSSENPTGDEAKGANPVVNAIDNKIEQAMDLVKSHLMYTVREEVEVLKEKIAELMERIQQLETENNFLRAQLPKTQNGHANGTPDPPQ